MRPLIEYKDMYALLDDLRKEGLFEQREAFLAQYDRAKKVEHVRIRIVSFLEKEKQVYRSDLVKRLRLDRAGKDITEEALNQLFVTGTLYVTQGPTHDRGGRRGSLLVWVSTQSETEAALIADCPVVRCAILGPHTHEIEESVDEESETEEAVPEEFGAPQPALMPSAILEEVAASPLSEAKVPQPKTMKSVLVSALTGAKT